MRKDELQLINGRKSNTRSIWVGTHVGHVLVQKDGTVSGHRLLVLAEFLHHRFKGREVVLQKGQMLQNRNKLPLKHWTWFRKTSQDQV